MHPVHEALAVLGICSTVLGLGLMMGFSPALYGLELRILTGAGSHGARAPIRAMVGGLVLGSTAMLLLFQVVDPQNLERMLRHRVDALLLRRGVDLAAGTLLVVVAAIVWWRVRPDRAARASGPGSGHEPVRISPREAWALGLGDCVAGVSGAATMYLTGRVITAASPDIFLRLGLFVLFVVTLSGPYLLFAAAWSSHPSLARRITHGYDIVDRLDLRRPVAVVLGIAGLVLLGAGLRG